MSEVLGHLNPPNVSPPGRRPGRRPRTVVAGPTQRGEFEQWDYRYLSLQAGPLYRTATRAAGIYAVGGTAYLALLRPPFALAFALIAFAGWAVLELWLRTGRRGVPALALLATTLNLLNSLPLLTNNPILQGVSGTTIQTSALTVMLYLLVLLAGWRLGLRSQNSRPSRLNLLPSGFTLAGGRGLALSLPLLGFVTLFHLGMISGWIYQLLPGPLAGLLPVLQAFVGAATMLGAFLGGLAVARDPYRGSSLVFWGVFTLTFFLITSSILLSAASVLVIGCAVGLGFRQRRIPWGFLMTAFLLVGFLNQGKFVMRERYWNQFSGSAQISLLRVPALYAEWSATSLAMLGKNWFGTGGPRATYRASGNPDNEGQSLVERLDNFRNLTFIVDVLERGAIQPLHGETYTLIPALLIPRVFWPDKPRAHEGQILLNLHFGRQNTVEETERTYVAWGLLPEAVGNFGCLSGAIFLGLVVGFGCGWLEVWSARKRILSVEGLLATALLVKLGTSYEMVASVLLTSTFQLLIAVTFFGVLLHLWFKNSRPVRRRKIQQAENGSRRS